MKNKVYIGWDIGGANTKICVFDSNFNIIRVECININIWSNFIELNNLFNKISKDYSLDIISNYITITAESCDNFSDRKNGILSILKNCNSFILGHKLFYTNQDRYIDFDSAKNNPEILYSTNWILTSKFVNKSDNIHLIIDIGSTTTDLIYKNIDVEENINDHLRLINNTLLYAGVIRTPISMLLNKVSYFSKSIPLVNEVFSTTGDVFNLTNDINFEKLDYLGADNLEYSKENSFKRLARSIGLDYQKEMQSEIIKISHMIKKELANIIFKKIKLLYGDELKNITMSSIGEGSFLAKHLAHEHKLNYFSIDDENIFTTDIIDKKILYKNFTAALVVENYHKTI